MADTYTQLYTHIVFAVKGRQRLIPKQRKEALHQYQDLRKLYKKAIDFTENGVISVI